MWHSVVMCFCTLASKHLLITTPCNLDGSPNMSLLHYFVLMIVVLDICREALEFLKVSQSTSAN